MKKSCIFAASNRFFWAVFLLITTVSFFYARGSNIGVSKLRVCCNDIHNGPEGGLTGGKVGAPSLFYCTDIILNSFSMSNQKEVSSFGHITSESNRATCESGIQVNPQTGEIRTPVGTSEQLPADLSISRETRNFLACLLSLQNLYSQVYDAVTCMYGEYQVDDITNQRYWPAHAALEDAIYEFLGNSIKDNLGQNNLI